MISQMGIDSGDALFYALLRGAPGCEISRIVQRRPSVLRARNAAGRIPLHEAVLQGYSVAVLATLIGGASIGNQGLLLAVDAKGRTALHHAVAVRYAHAATCSNVLQALVDDGQHVLQMADYHGEIPLHRAIGKHAQVQTVVNFLLSCDIRTALTKNHSEETALHLGFHVSIKHHGSRSYSVADRTQLATMLLGVQENIRDLLQQVPGAGGSLQQAGDDFLLTDVDLDGQTPLHIALSSIYPQPPIPPDEPGDIHLTRLIRLLVDSNERVLFMSDYQGDTPLHIVAKNARISLPVVQALLPSSITPAHTATLLSQANLRGDTALHTVLQTTNSAGRMVCTKDLIDLLQGVQGAVLRVRNHAGDTPLMTGLLHKIDRCTTQQLLGIHAPLPGGGGAAAGGGGAAAGGGDEVRQDLVQMQNHRGQTPLHVAALSRSGTGVLELLAGVRGDLLLLRDAHDNTPLHYAVAKINYASNRAGMAHLVGTDTAIFLAQNAHGNTPLHVAMHTTMQNPLVLKGLIERLLDADRAVLLLQDVFGRTPLHVALQRKKPLCIIEMLVGANSSVLLTQTLPPPPPAVGHIAAASVHGDTPLHTALRNDADIDIAVVRLLIDANQEVLRVRNSATSTPLHTAIGLGTRTSLDRAEQRIRLLIDHTQSVLLMCDDDTRQTPLHLAVKAGCSLHILRLLVDPLQLVLRLRATSELVTPLHLAMQHDAQHPPASKELLIDTLRTVLLIPNRDGLTPLAYRHALRAASGNAAMDRLRQVLSVES